MACVLAALAQESLLSNLAAAGRVYRDRVEPHWFANGTRFWYRNDGKDGTREFIAVDAVRGTRAPAFDHQRVAAAWSQQTGDALDPTHLPIESLEFAGDSPSILLRGKKLWQLNLDTYAMTPLAAADRDKSILPFDRRPRPSRNGGADTEIAFVNRLDVDVELFWSDADGRRHSYGIVTAGKTHAQHTFAGHVWVVTRLSDNEIAAVFEAVDHHPATAIIENQTPTRGERLRRGASSRTLTTAPSPDGKWEAFVKNHNLWLKRLDEDAACALSVDATADNTFRKDASRKRIINMAYNQPDEPATLPEVFWSPDSKWLVALQTPVVPEPKVTLVESSPRDQLQPKVQTYPYLKPGDAIPVGIPRLFHVETKSEAPIARDLFPTPWELDHFRWDADSTRFTFLDNERGHQRLRVIAVTAANEATNVIVDEHSDTFIDYAGKLLLDWISDDELLWMSERDGWNHLWLYDARSGHVKQQVTQGHWNVRDVIRVDREQREVWFRAMGLRAGQDPYHIHIGRVGLDGSGLVVLTEGDGTHSVQWSPDRQFFLDTWSRVDHPPVTELRRSADGVLVCRLEQADASEVLSDRGRWPERFVAKGRDGATEIWGIVHRPKDFNPTKKYPVIENIYAGPHGQHVPKAFRPDYRHQQAIADRGFIVVQIDGMGTSWRSKAFHDVCWKNLRDAGFPDRIAWMKAAAETFPEFDLSRVGIYGGSAGGQNALAALLWHGDFYKAAVADCGCHDNRMDKIWWNEQWLGWPVGTQYTDNSNVVHAHQLQGRLMLVVGELDRNVDPASTMQVAHALVTANKDFELVIVPGAGHGACETPWAARKRIGFFQRHLLTMAAE